jgi:hypothetical protein
MIEQVKSYRSKDGQIHSTLAEAQKHELGAIVNDLNAAENILANADVVIAILKLKPRKAKQVKKAVKPAKVTA